MHRLIIGGAAVSLVALATGCGGTSPQPAPAAPATGTVTYSDAYQTQLGTPSVAITRRFGPPLARYLQPSRTGGAAFDCAIYPQPEVPEFVRFCFRDGRLRAVGTATSADLVSPAEAPRNASIAKPKSGPQG